VTYLRRNGPTTRAAAVGAGGRRLTSIEPAIKPGPKEQVMATRDGSAEWRGDLRSGSGTASVASGLFSDGNYSFSSRFEEGSGTNPEELIAAAHAGCFSMALSNILAGEGHTPDSVRTTAKVHLRNVDGNPTIAQIDLITEGRVPDIDQAQFTEYAEQAKAGCPVSRALTGVGEISLESKLLR
jgi:lipoyl-dependent peroxiredoxin